MSKASKRRRRRAKKQQRITAANNVVTKIENISNKNTEDEDDIFEVIHQKWIPKSSKEPPIEITDGELLEVKIKLASEGVKNTKSSSILKLRVFRDEIISRLKSGEKMSNVANDLNIDMATISKKFKEWTGETFANYKRSISCSYEGVKSENSINKIEKIHKPSSYYEANPPKINKISDGGKRFYLASEGRYVKAALCSGRHDFPEHVKQYVFEKEIAPEIMGDYKRQEDIAKAFLKSALSDTKVIGAEIYASGCQPPLVSVINAFRDSGKGLTIMHYDPTAPGCYRPQVVYETEKRCYPAIIEYLMNKDDTEVYIDNEVDDTQLHMSEIMYSVSIFEAVNKKASNIAYIFTDKNKAIDFYKKFDVLGQKEVNLDIKNIYLNTLKKCSDGRRWKSTNVAMQSSSI